MTMNTKRSQLVTAALVGAVLSVAQPSFAQGTFRTTTPGSAFTVEKGDGRIAGNAAGGRAFRGGQRELVILVGTIRVPPATSAVPKLQKLIVHFRTSDGPRLLSVALHSGSNVFRFGTNITGDYVAREAFKPATDTPNAWVFRSTDVRAPLVVRLSVEFGGGFEGIADPGEFVLTGVVTDFQRAPLGSLESTRTSGTNLGPWLGQRPPAAPPSAPRPNKDALSANEFAAKGRAIADANPLVADLRATEPEGSVRTGFDIGMGAWLGHTGDGAGKQALGKALTAAEQLGFSDAAVFSVQWNNNTEFAAKGAAIAEQDPEVAAARAKVRGTPPDGLRAALYWLGFDIATGIFGDPKLGAQGNTLIGPGSEKIRATLGPDGQQGFNDSLAFNVVRR